MNYRDPRPSIASEELRRGLWSGCLGEQRQAEGSSTQTKPGWVRRLLAELEWGTAQCAHPRWPQPDPCPWRTLNASRRPRVLPREARRVRQWASRRWRLSTAMIPSSPDTVCYQSHETPCRPLPPQPGPAHTARRGTGAPRAAAGSQSLTEPDTLQFKCGTRPAWGQPLKGGEEEEGADTIP